MASCSLQVHVELDKEVYLHGEPVHVNITATNELIRQVHAIKISYVFFYKMGFC
jgi:hypothetical protein